MDVAGRHHLARWEILMPDSIEMFMKQSLLTLTVPDATLAVHQSTAETWEPAAINRNRLEEAMRSTERGQSCETNAIVRKKKMYRPCLSRFYRPFDIVCKLSGRKNSFPTINISSSSIFSYAIL